MSRSVRNSIVAPVREHSRKPNQIYEVVEQLYTGPYVELFARYPRDGWSQWGDQLDTEPACLNPIKPGYGSDLPVANRF
jgi:N6-adenosine-specific RNA methylase IME4